jgi:hypothetical protein
MKADMQIVTGNGLQEDVKNRTVMLTAENWIEMKSVAPCTCSLARWSGSGVGEGEGGGRRDGSGAGARNV